MYYRYLETSVEAKASYNKSHAEASKARYDKNREGRSKMRKQKQK